MAPLHAHHPAALGLQAYREILSQSRVLTQGQAPAQVKQIAERLGISAGTSKSQLHRARMALRGLLER